MREVKRYSPDALGDMREGRHGEYVLASEFDRVFLELSEHKNGNVLALLRAGMASACDKRDAQAAELAKWEKAFSEVHKPALEEAHQYIGDLRAELAEARELLSILRRMINCTPENDADQCGVWISTKHPAIKRIDAFLGK
jgi:predicted DNA-binding transcriptional regulator YafY